MPAVIDRTKCDGCKLSAEPPCVRACPGDVVEKDFSVNKAKIRCKAECWDCYACVKACPRKAIQVTLPYAMARREGALSLVEHGAKWAVWQVDWPDGRSWKVKRPAHISALEDLKAIDADVFKGFGI